MGKPLDTELTSLGRKSVIRFQNKVTRKRAKRKRAKRKKIGGAGSPRLTLTADEKRQIKAMTRSKCHMCGKHLKVKIHFDHVKPKSLGGSDELGNLLPICGMCNRSRWNGTSEQLSEALQIGMWAASQIRRETPLGRSVANAWGKARQKTKKRRTN